MSCQNAREATQNAVRVAAAKGADSQRDSHHADRSALPQQLNTGLVRSGADAARANSK